MAKPKILQQLNAEASSQILLKEDPDVAMEAATKQYVDNSGGIFYAIYGTTTYAEIVEAFNKGKGVKALYSNTSSYVYIYDLATRPTGSNTLYFVSNEDSIGNFFTPYTSVFKISPQNVWNELWSSKNETSFPIDFSGSTTSISSTTRYYRPILASTNPPSSTDGGVGDIWVVYSNE